MAVSLFKWLFACVWLFCPGGTDLCNPGSFTSVQRGIGCGGAESVHPLYISVTEINHNVKDRVLEVSCKIFTNDFESVLEKLAKTKVDLSDAGSKKSSEKLIAEYLSNHLHLKIDGKPVVLQFAGYEKEAEGTWSYFQVSDVTTVKRIDIVNSILYDGFTQEMNIMHVTVGGVRKSMRLNYPDTVTSFEF
jgi:uncharacterized protein DUF6702